MLCHAWVRVSTDPITGNNQKKQTFWRRVFEDFVKQHEVVNEQTTRNQKTCDQRFQLIRAECNKWSAAVKKVNDHPCSGENAVDAHTQPIFSTRDKTTTSGSNMNIVGRSSASVQNMLKFMECRGKQWLFISFNYLKGQHHMKLGMKIHRHLPLEKGLLEGDHRRTKRVERDKRVKMQIAPLATDLCKALTT